MYKEIHSELVNCVKLNKNINHIVANYLDRFCPEVQFIYIHAISAEHYPNGISQNSIYFCFTINFALKKIELHSCGHVWLSPTDKEGKYKYYAMRSMVDIAQDYGVKKFRKCGFKTIEECATKINKYYDAVLDAIKKYTGDIYPYKHGI